MTTDATTHDCHPDVLEVDIEGWPAVQIDPTTGSLRVNDLRATQAYSRRADATSPSAVRHQIHLRIDPERGSLCIATGSVVAWIDRDLAQPTRALVRAVNDECVALLDCVVRFRQEPAVDAIPSADVRR